MKQSLLPHTALLVGASLAAFSASAAVTNLAAVADASLLQVNPDFNMGGHTNIAAGTMANGTSSRALLQFNPAAHVPAGSTINSISVSVAVTAVGSESSSFALHRMLVDWGEGNKTGQSGAAASPGESTWNERFAGSVAWTSPGAAAGSDFSSSLSAVVPITGFATYTFASTPALVADVQSWLDNPSANFGWMLLSQSEGLPGTARRFATHEDSLGRGPVLSIDFTPIPEPSALALIIGATLVLQWRRSAA